MPELGEICRCRELGLKGTGRRIWQACIDCGKERWVELRENKPAYQRCSRCNRRAIGLANRGKYIMENAPNWHTGWYKDVKGYIRVLLRPNDFFYLMADKTGYVLEHRLIMAKHLGRNLHSWEVVHHKGTKYPSGSVKNRGDNRIENLQLVSVDRHNQITLLELKVAGLERDTGRQAERITALEAELVLLYKQLEQEVKNGI